MAKILLVDGHEEIRELLVTFLCSHLEIPNELVSLNSGEDAQRAVQEASPPFDLIITGNWLEQKNGGTALTRWLKEHFPKTPVILMSGLKEPAHHHADVFVEKPFDVQTMGEIVTQLLVA